MNVEQLEGLLDRHGPHEHDWPESVREQARALIAQDQAARDLLREASEVSSLLNAATPPPVPAGLAARIRSALPEDARSSDATNAVTVPFLDRFIGWLGGQLWRPVGLAFAPLLLGFAIGLQFQQEAVDIDDAMIMLAFSEPAFFQLEELGDAQ